MKLSKIFLILSLPFLLSGVSVSQNYWTNLNGPYGGNVIEIKKHSNGNLYLIRSDGAYFSSNSGLSWSEIDNLTLGSNLTMDFSPSGTIYLGKSSAGIWWSPNGGQSWDFNPINVAPHSGQWASVITLAVSPTGVVFANNYRSFNGGTTFNSFTVATGAFPYSYDFNPSGHVFAGTTNGIYRSNDNGSLWVNITGDLQMSGINEVLYENENSIFALVLNSGVYKTTNAGTNWILMNNGMTDNEVNKIYLKDGKLFAGTATGKLFVSVNSGNSWSLVTNMPEAGKINAIFSEENSLFLASALKGVSFSQDNGVSWAERNQNLFVTSINDLAFQSNDIFAASMNGVYHAPDNGNSWTRKNNGLPTHFVNTVYRTGNGKLFAGIQNFGIYASDNSGNSWTASNSGLITSGVFSSIKESNGFLYTLRSNSTAGDSIRLYCSTDNGNSWQNVFISHGFFLNKFTIDSQGKLFIGGLNPMFQPVLHSSTDNGNSWSKINYSSFQMMFDNFTSSGNDLYMTTSFNVLKSTNSGANWFSLNNGNWGSSQLGTMNVNSRGDIFVHTGNTIYLTTNDGASWEEKASGIVLSSGLKKFIFDGNGFIYTLTNNHGIFKSTESTLTGTIFSQSGTPTEFKLHQNFPNPFNPVTVIRYSLRVNTDVSLKIYDILGKEIKTLVNRKQIAGIYEVKFNAEYFSGGIYFYQLKADEFIQTKKMVLVK